MTNKAFIYIGIILFVLFFYISYLHIDSTTLSGDWNEYLNNGYRTFEGDIPYKDFWVIFPLGEMGVPALIFALFGLSLLPIILFSALANGLIGLLVYVIIRELTKDDFISACIALIAFFVAILRFYGGGYIYYVFVLLAVYFFIKKHPLTAGLFISLAFLFRIYFTGAFLAAMLLTLVIYCKQNKEANILNLLFFPAIIAIASFLFVGLNNYTIMFKYIFFEGIEAAKLMYLPYFSSAFDYLPSIFFSYTAFLLYLLPLIVIILSIKYFRKNYKVMFFVFLILFMSPKLFGRADISHLAYVLIPSFILLGVLSKKAITETKGIRFFYLAIVIVLLMLSAIHCNALLEYNKPVDTDLELTLKIICRETDKHDYIVATSWHYSPIYLLSGRRNPTRYDNFFRFLTVEDPEEEIETCNRMVAKAKLVIHNPNFAVTGTEELVFSDRSPYLQKCIEDNFELIAQNGQYGVYKKIDSD